MACQYGNCNDANCAAGQDSDVNGNPCDDASCPPCGSIAVTGGVPATTVAPNPSIIASSANASTLTQMSSVLGQWGATIAGIATGTPTVVSPQGARTGAAAVTPNQLLAGGNNSMMLLLLVVVGVVVVAVAFRRR